MTSWKVHKRGLIIALDVESLPSLVKVIEATASIDGVVGYKIGASLVIRYGLGVVAEQIRKRFEGIIIYDHQKAGSDIPDISRLFMDACASASVDAVIIFPLSGPQTLISNIQEARLRDLIPIVGGYMTHSSFLESEGGYVAGEAPGLIYALAAELGVTEFVLPGTKPQIFDHYRNVLTSKSPDIGYWFPGIGKQGGSIKEIVSRVAGGRAYPIVGSNIYLASDASAAARELISELLEV